MLLTLRDVRCPICGAAHVACGPVGTGTPIDVPKEGATMSGELKEYEVVTDGGYTTTLMLSDEDAKARGLTQAKLAEAPANKARPSSRGKGA